MNNNKCGLYIRVSTLKQVEEGLSLEAQREKLIKICEINKYSIYKIYTDEGISGKDTKNRPSYNDMIQDMKSGLIKKVLVMKLDRISRNLVDLENFIRECQENNCEFESATEKIDTSNSVGMMFVRMLGIFAQFERERITERVKEVFDYKIYEEKTTLSGRKIYGFDFQNKKFIINIEEANKINEMFDYYLETRSTLKTTQWWNENIGKLHYSNVSKKLKDKRYTGIYTYHGKEIYDLIPQIVNTEKFNEVQKMLEHQNKIYKTKSGTTRTYIFSGLIICPDCKHTLSGIGRAEYKYYRCHRCHQKNNCNYHSLISEGRLEKYLLKNLPFLIGELEIKSIKLKDKIIKDQTPKIQSKICRLKELYIDGYIDKNEYVKRYTELDTILNVEKDKYHKNNIVDVNNTLGLLKSFNIIEIYNRLDDLHKQGFWKKIIKSIEVRKNDFFITFR